MSLLPRDATPAPLFVLMGATADELLLNAVLFLERAGYEVREPGQPGGWESRAEFCARVGVSVSHFKRRMRRRKHAPEIEEERGPTGRLVRLRSTEAFDDWMRKRG